MWNHTVRGVATRNPRAGPRRFHRREMTILIVDDDANVRRLLRQLLEHLGGEIIDVRTM